MSEHRILDEDNRGVRVLVAYDAIKCLHALFHLDYGSVWHKVEHKGGSIYLRYDAGYFEVEQSVAAES